MRRITLIIFLFFAAVNSLQSQTITIDVQNTPVRKIILDMLKFFPKDSIFLHYENSSLDRYLNESKNFKVTNAKLNHALDLLFSDLPISYHLEKHHLTLRFEPKIYKTHSPKHIVSGKIISNQDEPLHGAAIQVPNRKKSYSTKEDGTFNIEVERFPLNIEVSYVGYESTQFEIKDSTPVLIGLNEVVEELETMINTGYIRQAKDRFTGTLSSLTAQEISQNNIPDLMQNIASQIPGMIQHFNFDPNNNIPQYQIRGRTTIHANPNPLIILDQIPYQSDMMNIHPEDILRVDVLKDAAAAAIWGARSGNGVIVFTTKEGKLNNKAKVSASLSSGISRKKDLFADDYLSSSEIIDLELRLFDQDYYDIHYTSNRYPLLSPVVELKYLEKQGVKTTEEVNAAIEKFRQHDIRNDIKNYLQRNASYTQANVQLIGGGKQNSYFFSIGNLNQQHELPHKRSNRITVNSKNRFLPFNGIELANHIIYTEWNHQLPHDPTERLQDFIQYAPWADEKGNPINVPFEYRQTFKDSMISNLGYGDWSYSPLTEYQNNHTAKYKNELLFQLSAKFKVKKRLHFDFIYNFNYGNFQDIQRWKEPSYAYRSLYNTFAWKEGNEIKSIIPPGEILNEGLTKDKTQTYRYTATYHFRIPKWGVQSMVVLGGEVRTKETQYTNEWKFGYDNYTRSHTLIEKIPSYFIFNNTSKRDYILKNNNNSLINENYFSEFFLVTNNWKNKIILETNIRRDASNLFGFRTNEKFLPLWSLGLKLNPYNFRQKEILKNTEINFSFGKTGNIHLNSTPLLQVINDVASDGTELLSLYKPSDPNLKWEVSSNLNFGFQRIFEKHKITFGINYYNNNSKDLIIYKKIDPTLGNITALTNGGVMHSRGFEIFFLKGTKGHKTKLTNQINFHYNTAYIIKYPSDNLIKRNLIGNNLMPLPEGKYFNVYASPWNGVDPNNGNVLLPHGYGNSIDYFYETGLESTIKIGNLLPDLQIKWISTLDINNKIKISATISYISSFLIKTSMNTQNISILSYNSFHSSILTEIIKNINEDQLTNSLEVGNLMYIDHSNLAYQLTKNIRIENINFSFTNKNYVVAISSNNPLNISTNFKSKKLIENLFLSSIHISFKTILK